MSVDWAHIAELLIVGSFTTGAAYAAIKISIKTLGDKLEMHMGHDREAFDRIDDSLTMLTDKLIPDAPRGGRRGK